MDEGYVEEADDAEYCAKARALNRVFEVGAQHVIRCEDEPEYECECELCIPDPPRAPDGFCPDCTCD